jgi:hypothetical protein
MRSRRRAWTWILAAGMLPVPAQGQSVLVRAFDVGSGQPLQGALVTLETDDEAVRSVLTDARGRFLFTGLAPGSYSVRIELIGYASREQAVTVDSGQTRAVDLGLESHAIELEGLSVEGEERCTLRPEAGLRVAEVWDEVRKALEAALWTEEQGVYEYRTRRYSRDVEEQTGLVKNQQTRRGRVYLQAPYESRPAEDLIDNGFIQSPSVGEGGDVYYAPDASVMLSDLFLDSHCMRLRSGEGDEAGMVGLAFEPLQGRRIPDIAGTLWVDPGSWRLSHLEYSYRNVGTEVEVRGIGGRVDFQVLPNGTWIVPEWRIRTPWLALGRDIEGRETIFQYGYHEEGATVLSIREPGGEVIFSASTAALDGVVMEGPASEPVAGAVVSLAGSDQQVSTDADGRFRFTEVAPGRYDVTVRHPTTTDYGLASPPVSVELVKGELATVVLLLTSPLALHEAECREELASRPEGSAILVGRVTDRASAAALEGARVTIEWDDFSTVELHGYVRRDGVVLTTEADGSYRACLVPTDALLRITAEWGGHATVEDTVRVPEGEPGMVYDIQIRAGAGTTLWASTSWHYKNPRPSGTARKPASPRGGNSYRRAVTSSAGSRAASGPRTWGWSGSMPGLPRTRSRDPRAGGSGQSRPRAAWAPAPTPR